MQALCMACIHDCRSSRVFAIQRRRFPPWMRNSKTCPAEEDEDVVDVIIVLGKTTLTERSFTARQVHKVEAFNGISFRSN